MIQIKNNIADLKLSATRTSVLFCDNSSILSLMKYFILKLEQIEDLIQLDNETHLTEVAEAIHTMYKKDTELTHINIKFQVRAIQSEKKECIINAKYYI